MKTLLLLVLLCVLLEESNTYDMFYEGYNNLKGLPGSATDPRGLPNIPFSTDTNRLSDGFTSSAPVDITSPHFPVYQAYKADVTRRYLHYTEYAKSAAEQGIGVYGAGDAIREDARLAITSQPNYTSLPNPTKTFPVYAAIKWNPSDFAIQEGETYSVTVNGSQTGFSTQFWSDGGIRVNAEGYESYYDAISNCHVGMGRCRSHLRKRRRLETANWMQLACSIGQFVIPLQEIEPGHEFESRYLPLDESVLQETIFAVGQTVTFRAIYTGQLICFANDAQSEYWNNAGWLNVTVTRVSWPPDQSSYYRELYLPSCDSALAVYANYGWGNDTSHRMACNPNGGGAGWTKENIFSKSARYTSGMP